MIRIALCDSDRADLEAIRALLARYAGQRNRDLHISAYTSPLELLAASERGVRFDVLMLDILMPGQNGIEAAAEIRQRDRDVKILFLTASPEFGVEAYSVNACQYLLKPIREDRLFPVLDSVFATCEKEKASGFLLRCKGVIVRLMPGQVEYCEVNHRTLLLRTTWGQTLESMGHMSDLMEHLSPYGCFLQVHRSYFVNMDHIQQISYRGIVTTSGASIPIPRGKYNELKDLFLRYMSKTGQALL